MKLRNKEIGLTGILTSIEFNIDDFESEIDLSIMLDNNGGECIDRQFYSLDELKKFLRDWEEYIPKEPLIKDEKIRKAVRAWVDAEGIEEVAVLCHTVWEGKMTEIAKPDDTRLEITFRRDLGIKMGKYSITELCGEEEE